MLIYYSIEIEEGIDGITILLYQSLQISYYFRLILVNLLLIYYVIQNIY